MSIGEAVYINSRYSPESIWKLSILQNIHTEIIRRENVLAPYMQSSLLQVYPGEKCGGTEQTPQIQSHHCASDQTDQISALVKYRVTQMKRSPPDTLA